MPVKNEMSRQQPNQFHSYSSADNQKGNASQSQIIVRRINSTENQTNLSPVKVQQQQPHQNVPQVQIVTQAPKGPPLQAQITSQPLPNGSQPINNQYPPVIRVRQGEGNQTSVNLQPQHQQQQQPPHPIQMEHVKLFYTPSQLQDPSTINPQLLPHRQLNAKRLQMEQQMKELERQRKIDEEKAKESSNTQQQPKQQSQVQPIVIQSSNAQQSNQLQSQPRLREALQNAGGEPQRQVQLVQAVSASSVHTSASQRPVTTKQSPTKSVLQPQQHPSQTQSTQMQQQNNVYFIDSSRYIRLASRDQLVGVQPFAVTGNQGIRYYLPQNISTQAIAVTPSPQKPQQSKVDDGKFDRLLRASSIDHLLPDAPEHDSKIDDNIDWSVYEEPKPSKSTQRKAPTPRKRGAAIKVDSNSDAMARISPILAKFQQEMAQSTVAQEQQHQQELTMAARNAAKPTPVRARKRPTKAEKEAAAKLASNNQDSQTPSASSSAPSSVNNQHNSSHGSNLQTPNTIENKDNVVNDIKQTPAIIVTAATPDPGQANRQKPNTVDVTNVQTCSNSQQISHNIRSQ
uniref:Uncharacterized protein n=1 Tax=Panagrolaimus superbus TaxID=310955 RepID=A0A914Z5S6_9BILA